MTRRYLQTLAVLFFITLLVQCARRGSPTGGPKDETPPVLISANPTSGTTNFKAKKIRFVFDELVVTKDLRKQLIISPPFENFPLISPTSASRWLEITITDTLSPNTTYVMNFGNSIQDYNEGNPYPFFKYVFSTGDFIDSLDVKGRIEDAFSPKPDNFVSVMLYEYNEAYSDSLVYKQRPLYVTNTLDSLTTFEIGNVRPGKYVLIGLKDKNNNYLFNQKEDKIAFSDSIITVGEDSLAIAHTLRLFKEIRDYKATRPSQVADNRIIFGFEGQSELAEITPISAVTDDFKSFITKEPQKDTLNYWYRPKQNDSIVFTVRGGTKIDTFKVRLKEMKPDSMQLSTTFSGNLPFGKVFGWKSNTPIVKTDSTKVAIFTKDSLSVPFTTRLEPDHLQFSLLFEPKHNEQYRIEALPEAITDFFGQTNDTLNVSLRTKKYEDYAVLKMNINMPMQFPAILQLTNEKGDTVEQELIVKEARNEYLFENVNPGKYRFRIIFDTNDNGRWDTGNFLQRLQPEWIFYHKNLIELRANWEVEEDFIRSE
ncbi:MAG: Ig-like domain-containing protein [Capnocytophaga sp.]|nr:Ig-like domain-containing protein [Capnocytophaga sp.]